MSAAPITQEDLANVCKLLERLRTGEMNLIPSLVPGIESRDPTGKSEAMLQRVEELLTRELRRMDAPLDDGGPAFPRKLPEIKVSPDEAPALIKRYDGMTLRDYFAAKAMPMLAAEFYSHKQALADGDVPSLVSTAAYQFADAMLKARQA